MVELEVASDAQKELDVFAMIDAHRPVNRPGQGYGEVASYCSLPIQSKCNALEWWKGHEMHYPHLAKMARLYLGMAASSATEERVFSRGSLVQTFRRTRLGDDIFESQVISGHNKSFIDHLKVKY